MQEAMSSLFVNLFRDTFSLWLDMIFDTIDLTSRHTLWV